MGQLNPFEWIQTSSAAAAACAARGLSHSVANSALFARRPQTICTQHLHAIRTALAPVLLGLFFFVFTFLFTISRWQLPLLQMQRLLACPKTPRDALEPVYGRRPYGNENLGANLVTFFEQPYGRALLRRVSTKVGVSRQMKRSIKRKIEEVVTPTMDVWSILKVQMPKSRCVFESVFESMQVLQTCTLNLFQYFK